MSKIFLFLFFKYMIFMDWKENGVVDYKAFGHFDLDSWYTLNQMAMPSIMTCD